MKVGTCKKRRKGRGGPFEMGPWWLEEWRHVSLPLLPQMTLQPETTSSKNHKSGSFCQSTNPPVSSLLFTFTLFSISPWWNSDAVIFIWPVTHMLCTAFNAACPPVAAMYCCTMYFAVEACWSWQIIKFNLIL